MKKKRKISPLSRGANVQICIRSIKSFVYNENPIPFFCSFFFHREQCYKWLASFFRTQNKISAVDSDGLSNISNDLEYLIKVSNYFKYCSKLRIPKKS